ncbi:MAG: GIY-YIG nuclease family protein [Candidatus Poribacteria bacterium]|nr:GIY-YIG nuclease family protein [Candidatus Poribacteria bacterium]
MKVVFRGNETADVSEIQSVLVITAAKRIEVHLKRKTGKTEEKVRALPLLKADFEKPKPWAEEVAKDLERFSEAPEAPINQVIASAAWSRGFLQVELDVNSDISAHGLARLCWCWRVSNTPKAEDLEFRTGLSTDEIEEVTGRDIYKQHVKDLMFKGRDAKDYKKWATKGKYSGNNLVWFGTRMRLPEDTAAELINAVAEKYGINLSDLKGSLTPRRKNMIPNADLKPEKTIGSGNSSVYLYYYPQYRESAESKGEKVWECKIGRTIHSEADGRIRDQATGLPEVPKIGLHIKTGKEKKIERIIHDVLKLRGKHIEEAPGTEWFLTSPSEVEEIYNFIGENSHESASDG